jgi:hypothetical protein
MLNAASLSKVLSGLFILVQVIISLALFALFVYVILGILRRLRLRLKDRLYRRKLPSLIIESRSKICSIIRDANNKLSDEKKIGHETWKTVSGMVDTIMKSGYVLNDLEMIERQRIPTMIWKIYLEWENAIQPTDLSPPERKKIVRESALNKIREEILPELENYRRMRTLHDRVNLDSLFIADR